MKGLNVFWRRVMKCKHENLSPNYYELLYCGTPYCRGYESHCLDCGIYISECDCGAWNGMSGWPHRKWRTEERKKDMKRRKLGGVCNEV